MLTTELKKGVPNSKLKHKIELTEGSDPPGQRLFRLSAAEATENSKQLTKLIDLGLLWPSNVDFGALAYFACKEERQHVSDVHRLSQA